MGFFPRRGQMDGSSWLQGVDSIEFPRRRNGRGAPTPRIDPGHHHLARPRQPDDREQTPLARHTLEGVLAASGKAEARPGDQVNDDARDEHLARSGRCCHTRGDMDGDAADVVVAQLDLTRVHARPHLDTQAPPDVADRDSTPDRAREPLDASGDTSHDAGSRIIGDAA
jgi:hypothetical protein